MPDVWTTPKTYGAEVATASDRNTYERDNHEALHNTLVGDGSASGLIHRHKSGPLASRPAAGNAGRIYVATDSGTERAYYDDGTNWQEIPLLDDGATAAASEGDVLQIGSSGIPEWADNPLLSLIGGHQSGEYYGSQGRQTQTDNFATGTLYACPILIPATITYDRIALTITSASGNIRLGIYEDDGGLPGALVLDAGSAPAGTPLTEITISQGLTGPARYWLASSFSGTNTVSDIIFNSFLAQAGVNKASFTFGALPDPFGSITGWSSAVPSVNLRAS